MENTIEATYEKYEDMLWKLTHKTCARYSRVSMEEVFAEAQYVFLKAVESYDASGGTTFSTWLYTNLSLSLGNFGSRQGSKRAREEAELTFDPPAPANADREDLLSRFTADAKMVVGLALTAPEDLTRGLITEILKDMGWARARIRATIKEVREAI